MLDRDQPLLAECLDGFADRSTTHAELLGEIALGRKLLTEFELGCNDLAFDLLYDALIEPLRMKGLICHRFS
jgi:hypothetical protein